MKKNLKASLLFITLLFFILLLIETTIKQGVKYSEKGQTGKVNQVFRHKLNHEVVMFGASNGEVGFSAALFSKLSGKTAFNMCIDGTDISQYGDLVKELCDYSDTKQLIFALPPNGMFDAKLPTEVNRYLVWFNNSYIKENEIYHNYEGFYKLSYIPFYGFTVYNNIFYRTSFDGWARKLSNYNKNSCYETLGWNPMNVEWGEKNSSLVMKDSLTLLINPNTLKIMDEIITLVKSKNKTATFVIMPAESSAFKMFKNYTAYKKSIIDLTQKHQIQLLDFNEDSSIMQSKYYYNFTHLNKTGAELFTQKLSEQLK